ncbi:hypothetical protein JOB18_026262 [Solea senegalensis]|uniref:Uncharacterized protein n=1 Tax=Solea senegalensis TaxID=28829 RepID=A0AAV6PSA4_SOLSE|nr:hypothetical protein JOB18_026262 [Solea senegalensis]
MPGNTESSNLALMERHPSVNRQRVQRREGGLRRSLQRLRNTERVWGSVGRSVVGSGSREGDDSVSSLVCWSCVLVEGCDHEWQ